MKSLHRSLPFFLRRVACRVTYFATRLMLLSSLAIPAVGQAQATSEAAPVSPGFSLPRATGTLQYAVTASESLSSGYYGTPGIATATSLTGDLAYLSNSKLYPFSAVFTGGHSWATSSEPSYSFANLGVSESVTMRRWNLLLSNNVDYLPGTPTSGLSGVAGVGDLGINPAPTAANTAQGALTGFASQISDTAIASLQRLFNGKTSLLASGSYSILRFVDSSSDNNAGLNSDSDTESLAVTRRIDARNSSGASYAYSHFTYSGTSFGVSEPDFSSQTASLQYSYQLTRKFFFSGNAGPQWTSIDSPGSTTSLSLFANLSGNYTGRFTQMSLTYLRSSNSGFGVVGGAISDSISFSFNRTFDRVWLASSSVAYTQTENLPSANTLPFTFNTTVIGGQVSRVISRCFSSYASYTLENQSSQGTAASFNLFNGLAQIASIGLTYSPAVVHLGHR
jgi:hypothetical protein